MPLENVISFIDKVLAEAPTPAEKDAAIQSGVALSRFVEGMTAEQELRGELQALGYDGLVLERYVLAAYLRRGLELFRERKALWRSQVKEGTITPSDYADLLEQAGVSQEAVEQELQLIGAQKPKQALQSVEVFLAVLGAEELPARAALPAAEISLKIMEASAVEEAVTLVLPSEISLAILEAQQLPTIPAAAPVELSLAILSAQEV